MAKISDRDILATAPGGNQAARRNGSVLRSKRADQLEEQGAHAGALAWPRVLKQIERSQAMPPQSAVKH